MPIKDFARERVFHPRKLDDDAPLSLTLERGFTHAELIDSVPNRLERLNDGLLFRAFNLL